MGSGTIFNSVTKKDMYGIPVLLPMQEILDQFDAIIKPIHRHLEVLTLKNWNLRETRDLLLPKLISGEIDVEQLGADLEVDELAA
jgi:type I restriction enzyme S subunit